MSDFKLNPPEHTPVVLYKPKSSTLDKLRRRGKAFFYQEVHASHPIHEPLTGVKAVINLYDFSLSIGTEMAKNIIRLSKDYCVVVIHDHGAESLCVCMSKCFLIRSLNDTIIQEIQAIWEEERE